MYSIGLGSVTLSVVMVLAISGCGFWAFQKSIVSEETVKQLASLLLFIFLPCFIFYHTVSVDWGTSFDSGLWFVFLGFFVFLIALLFGFLIAYVFGIKDKRLFASLLAFQNCGYMPLIMIDSIFPDKIKSVMFSWVFLFIISFNLLVWSFGVWLVSGKKIESNAFVKKVFNPPFISTVLAVFISIFHVHVPDALMQILDVLGRPVLPLSMLIMGAMLAVSFKDNNGISSGDVDISLIFWAVVGKMFFLPVLGLILIIFMMKFFQWDYLVAWFSFLQFTLPSAVSLVIISTVYGGKSKTISWVLLLSHLVAIVSVPVAMYVFGILCK